LPKDGRICYPKLQTNLEQPRGRVALATQVLLMVDYGDIAADRHSGVSV